MCVVSVAGLHHDYSTSSSERRSEKPLSSAWQAALDATTMSSSRGAAGAGAGAHWPSGLARAIAMPWESALAGHEPMTTSLISGGEWALQLPRPPPLPSHRKTGSNNEEGKGIEKGSKSAADRDRETNSFSSVFFGCAYGHS